jgi:hypothetical protein
MAAQPYLRPAIDTRSKDMLRLVANRVEGEIRKAV